jgi:hypothetical protein
MIINLIALTILNAVIPSIGFVWVSTCGREMISQREHRVGIISEPVATNYGFVRD